MKNRWISDTSGGRSTALRVRLDAATNLLRDLGPAPSQSPRLLLSAVSRGKCRRATPRSPRLESCSRRGFRATLVDPSAIVSDDEWNFDHVVALRSAAHPYAAAGAAKWEAVTGAGPAVSDGLALGLATSSGASCVAARKRLMAPVAPTAEHAIGKLSAVFSGVLLSGAEGDRTPDLRIANAAR